MANQPNQTGGTLYNDSGAQLDNPYQGLYDQAQNEANQEINAQVAPYLSKIGALQSGEQGTLGGIGQMFGSLLPFVSDSAQRVEGFQKDALNMEQQIFSQAGARLNALGQSRAKEAQDLAQQMGGPVSTGEFTAATAPTEAAFPNMAAGSMLHSLAWASAGTQAAEQFAGQVFPALRTEQEAEAQGFYENQIKEARDNISQLQASKAGLANTKLNDLLTQQRQYDLNVKQQQLDRLKADRDWQATKHTLANDDARLALAKQAEGLSTAGVTGTYNGKPTLAAQKDAAALRIQQERADAYSAHLTVEEKQTAQRLGLSAKQYALQVVKSEESLGIQNKRLSVQQQHNAMGILDKAMNPNSGHPVTQSVKTFIPKGSLAELRAQSGKMADAHYDPQKKQWYQYQKLSLTPQQWAEHGGYSGAHPIHDPQRLYDLLVGSGTPKKMAVNMVRAKTGVNGFNPGGNTTYNADDLKPLAFNEVRGIAIDRGFKPDPKHKLNRQQLVDYVLHHNP